VVSRQTAIGSFLDSVRDAAPEQVRAERLWRFGPEQLPIATAQLRDRRFGQPLQFGLDLLLGCPVSWALALLPHDEVPAFAIR
jgi:hypothetical protein